MEKAIIKKIKGGLEIEFENLENEKEGLALIMFAFMKLSETVERKCEVKDCDACQAGREVRAIMYKKIEEEEKKEKDIIDPEIEEKMKKVTAMLEEAFKNL